MPVTACFTSFTYGYLARARVLAQTLKQAHPDWQLWALIVEEAHPTLDDAAAFADFDHVIRASELGIPGFRGWMFRHDLVEACTAVKATMLRRLLAQGADRVIYLDPDIAVFHPLDGIQAQLAQSAVVLTPHQLAPNTDRLAILDNELTSMKYGIYNLGFLGVRNCQAGHAFAQWWEACLLRACYDQVEDGIFTDQKYCDLVPSLFDGVHIARDPGCNVASWNLSRRHLAFGDGGVLSANGSPLKFYHFTKIGGLGDVMTERYAQDNIEVYEVVNWYKRRVAANTIPAAVDFPWSYSQFGPGVPIPRQARLIWRARGDVQAAYPDPFAPGEFGLHHWLQHQAPEVLVA